MVVEDDGCGSTSSCRDAEDVSVTEGLSALAVLTFSGLTSSAGVVAPTAVSVLSLLGYWLSEKLSLAAPKGAGASAAGASVWRSSAGLGGT